MWSKKIFAALTKKERIVFVIALIGACASFVVVMGIYIAQATRAIPVSGGTYTEGVLGQPEYINPVIATSQTDLALVKLVYSNLPELASSITPSPDLKTWDVRLKPDLLWQDGQQLTADDVIFTVQSIQNPDANSPLYQAWQGVTVNRVSELEMTFTLSNPYAFFGDTLANLYILPKHIFADAPPGNWHLSNYNLKPIGSGPYRFSSYDQTRDGFITSYNLTAWDGTSGPHPLIKHFDLQFFNDENALIQSFNNGTIDGFGNATPEDIAKLTRPANIFAWPTSGYYAVFFNNSTNIALQDPVVREALSAAINRTALVAAALGGKGAPEYGPVPPGAAYYAPIAAVTSSAQFAESLLNNAGWTTSSSSPYRSKTIRGVTIPLVVNLTVPQIDFLAKTASYLQTAWQAIGVQVNVLPDTANNIVQNDIPNRSYESLLFGNVLGPSSDLYSFWDSSQDFSPGLNLAIYSNPKVDTLIEQARQNPIASTTATELAAAQQDIANDYPAIFLYSPDYVYVANNNLGGVTTSTILADPSDHMNDVPYWYLSTARVLK